MRKFGKIIPMVMLLSIICSACAKRTPVIRHFDAEAGTVLVLPVDHSSGLYPETYIGLQFDPPITNHPNRDFSDIVGMEAFDGDGKPLAIRMVCDINGAGRDITAGVQAKKAHVKELRFEFKKKCSGRIELVSWQPE